VRATITTYYLEMTDAAALRPRRLARADVEIRRAAIPSPELNRFFYTAVGGDWYWLERLVWTYDRWLAYLERPELETWILWVDGTPAGYFELEDQPGGNVEIVYFGVLPRFTGQGLGGHLLTAAVERAWQKGAARVWLHTCTLDHPGAVANYRARGFQIFRTEEKSLELPDQPPGPWPGAMVKKPG
jgi:ribosomal protein S18 acetylase RimI-like enzyme